MKRPYWLILGLFGLLTAGCEGPSLETRTFEVRYLPTHRVDDLIAPYVFTEREGTPGMMSATEGAVTVRETADNLDQIARVLEQYDRPNPTVRLHFQIIEADGSADADPAIADVERELRRLFRFDGYDLVAETQVTAIQGTGVRQMVATREREDGFLIEGGVNEVRARGEEPTVSLDVQLSGSRTGPILQTSVTVPAGHSIVLGTANTPQHEGALILVVRAEILESSGTAGPGDAGA